MSEFRAFQRKTLSNPTAAMDVQREIVQIQATELICRILQEQNLPRAVLAERLGISPQAITSLLRGDQNISIGRLSDTLFVLGYTLQLASARLHEDGTSPNPEQCDQESATSASEAGEEGAHNGGR